MILSKGFSLNVVLFHWRVNVVDVQAAKSSINSVKIVPENIFLFINQTPKKRMGKIIIELGPTMRSTISASWQTINSTENRRNLIREIVKVAEAITPAIKYVKAVIPSQTGYQVKL
jgi:hypothetical protein